MPQPPREWISPDEAAKILDVSRSTVYRSLQDPARADELWGAGNWRRKPLSPRGDLQVRSVRAEELAATTGPGPLRDDPGDASA